MWGLVDTANSCRQTKIACCHLNQVTKGWDVIVSTNLRPHLLTASPWLHLRESGSVVECDRLWQLWPKPRVFATGKSNAKSWSGILLHSSWSHVFM